MDNVIVTPIGRMVQGNLYKPQTTNKNGQPLTYKDGRPREQYYIGLAIPKGPEFDQWWDTNIAPFGPQLYPAGQSQQPGFKWKRLDGDAPEHAAKEGFPGHWVLRMTSGWQPQIYDKNGQPALQETFIERGYFIRTVIGTVTANGSADTPGIFLNVSGVQFMAYGDVISSGPDCGAAFSAAPAPATLPPGATAAPTGGAQQPPVPAPQQPPAPGAPQAQQPPAPPEPVAPAPDFLNPPQMTAAANGLSYAQYQQAGWTDEQLIANGLMLPRQ